jgi:hypothetical protein
VVLNVMRASRRQLPARLSEFFSILEEVAAQCGGRNALTF